MAAKKRACQETASRKQPQIKAAHSRRKKKQVGEASDFKDAVILGKYGKTPDDLSEL